MTQSTTTGTRTDHAELLQLVTFSIDSEEFGVEILKVREIIRMMAITKVPNAPEFVEGIINLRGKVIPVIDLRHKFSMSRRGYDSQTRIIVVEVGTVIGFIVDSVSEVLRIPRSTVEPAPAIISGIDSEYISGVGKLDQRLLIMLDLDRVLSTQEQDQLKAA